MMCYTLGMARSITIGDLDDELDALVAYVACGDRIARARHTIEVNERKMQLVLAECDRRGWPYPCYTAPDAKAPSTPTGNDHLASHSA